MRQGRDLNPKALTGTGWPFNITRSALDVALKGRLGDEAVYKAATTLYEKHMSEGEFREAEKIAIEFKSSSRIPRFHVEIESLFVYTALFKNILQHFITWILFLL